MLTTYYKLGSLNIGEEKWPNVVAAKFMYFVYIWQLDRAKLEIANAGAGV